MPYTEILLSPFWESVDQRWIGASLLVLAILTLISQCMSIALVKSWRLFMASIIFAMLTAVLVSGYADSFSSRELQHFIVLPQTLTTLAVLNIVWTAVTVFGGVKMELDQNRRNLVSWCQVGLIRLITVIPSPIFILFIAWLENDLLLQSHDAKPQTVGLYVGGMIVVAQIAILLPLLLCFKRNLRIGLHLLTGCVLLVTGSLLPCLAQKIHIEANTQPLDMHGVIMVSSISLLFILFGVFTPSRLGGKL